MSRWEIQIALLISAGVVAISIPVSDAVESVPGVAMAVLETLPVKGRAPKTGYSRDMFGQSWADVDRNGCDTRNDILKRDMTSIVYKAKTRNCVVLSGTLIDRYSGETINFVRGNASSMEVQIDLKHHHLGNICWAHQLTTPG